MAARDAPTPMLTHNQLGRRNITLFCRCELAEKLAEALKPLAKENQKAGGGDRKSSRAKSGYSILNNPKVAAWKDAAEEASVSHGSLTAFKSKGWTQERIGEVLGMSQNTVSDWLQDRTNIGSDNASTPKDCRIKLSTPPTLPPMPKDAPTLAQRTALAILAGGVVATGRF